MTKARITVTDKQVAVIMEAAKILKHIATRVALAKNANASVKKAKANGNSVGRKKLRNDDRIKELRSAGHTYRQIMVLTGVSLASVQRGLGK